MSAIFGIFGDADFSELNVMSQRLVHHGPIGGSWSLTSQLHFGLRSSLRQRSTFNPPDFPAVFVGEIGNVEEIAQVLSLRGLDPKDKARLVFELYRERGPEGFGLISGKFAVAIWDEQKQALILASDAWGTCPLFYTNDNGRYLFASEYKALLAIPSVKAEPQRDVLQYLHCTKYIPPGASCLAGVDAVAGGTWVELSWNGIKTHAYRKVAIDIQRRSDAEHAQVLQKSFLRAVGRQISAFDSVGVALSGGLDSALIVSAVKKVAPQKPLYTFCAGFDGNDPNIVGAAEVAEHFETVHQEIFLSAQELTSLIPETLWHMEDPIGREEKIFYYITAKEAVKKSVPILLAGHNADALFGGMPRHLVVKLASQLRFFRKSIEEFYRYTQVGMPPKSFLGQGMVSLYFKGADIKPPQIRGAGDLPDWKGLPLEEDQPLNTLLRDSLCNGPNANSAIERIHDAFGLDFNSPFLDSDFVTTAFQIPDRLKIRGTKQKYILRQAGIGLMPEHMIFRKKGLLRLKHDTLFCDMLDQLVQDFLSPASVKSRALFEQEYINQFKRRSRSDVYSTDQIYRLWSLILTEVWCRMFIDARGEKPLL